MSRIFSRNLCKQINKWQYNAHPERKLELITENLKKKSSQNYQYVSKLGAVESLAKLQNHLAVKSKMSVMKILTENMYSKKIEEERDESLSERLELLSRQNEIMEELRSYKE